MKENSFLLFFVLLVNSAGKSLDPKDSGNLQLLKALNSALIEIFEDGTLRNITTKWIGETSLLTLPCKGPFGYTPKEEAVGIFKDILTTRTLPLGVYEQRPMNFLNSSNGRREGLEVDIANALTWALTGHYGTNFAIDWKIDSPPNTNFWKNLYDSLKKDSIGAFIALIVITEERSKQVMFGCPYFNSAIILLLSNQIPFDIPSLEVLKEISNISIGAVRGSYEESLIKNYAPNVNLVPFDFDNDLFEMLSSGKINAIIRDSSVIQSYLKENPGCCRLSNWTFATKGVGMAFRFDKKKDFNISTIEIAIACIFGLILVFILIAFIFRILKKVDHGLRVFSEDEITIEEFIDAGSFGQVHRGTWNESRVALKSLKINDPSAKQLLIQEGRIMHSIDHPNILKFFGTFSNKGIFYLVIEWASWELKKLLPRIDWKEEDLGDIVFQIANAMTYLESRRIIHRDLAARNIVVNQEGLNYKVKLGDFGMSKNDKYYKSNNHQKPFPLRWSAPEVIKSRTFSIYSDVWAFGVLLFEIFTLGEVPYSELIDKRVETEVPKGYRLKKPEKCPEPIYQLMKSCWNENPRQRPTFRELSNNLKAYSKKNTPVIEQNEGKKIPSVNPYPNKAQTPEFLI